MTKPKLSNITRQLLLGFCALISIFLLFGVYALCNIYRVSDLSRTIYNHPLIVSNAALKLNASIAKMHRSMKDVVLFHSSSKIQQSIEALNREEEEAYRQLDIVKKNILGDEGKALVNEARKLFDAWRPIRNEVIGLIHNDQRENAADITIENGANHVVLLDTKMLGLSNYARNKASELNFEEENLFSKLILTSTLFLVLGIFTSLLVAFFTLKLTLSTEKDLLKSKKRFSSAFNESPISLAIVDFEKGKRIAVNEKFIEFFGYSRAQLLSDNLYQTPLAADERELMEAVDQIKLDGFLQDYPFRMVTKNGDFRDLLLSASRISNEFKNQFIFSYLDITRAKELEKLVEIQDKMSALGRVSAGISHEIGNALASMNIELFNLHKIYHKDENIKSEEIKEIYDNFHSVYNRIKSIVKSVTDFSNPGELKFALTDINKPINTVIGLVEISLKNKGIRLEKMLTEEMKPCQADQKRIMQVILNIINNAAEALIDAEKSKRIKVISSVNNDRIIVRISDSGPGVSPGLREKVFDPFYTTKTRGTGIGLSLCQRIITDHGGLINVSSSKWGGAEFNIEIPTSGTVPERLS